MSVAQTIVTSGGGCYALLGHCGQYTIVKATRYPPLQMTIVCAQDILSTKIKLWKSLLESLLSSKALPNPFLVLQDFFNFLIFFKNTKSAQT